MAMKSVAAQNIAQASSGKNWVYSTGDSAYAGATGGTVYGVTVLRFDVPAFSGLSEAVDVALISYTGLGTDVTLRWALCTSDANRELYMKTTEEVADSYQVGSGTISIPDVTSTSEARKFQVPTTKIKGGNTYYLFLWAYNQTGLSIRAASSGWGEHSVSVGYNLGVVRLKDKRYMVYVKLGGVARQMIPYVKTPSGLRPGG